jgi:hypothetical protein
MPWTLWYNGTTATGVTLRTTPSQIGYGPDRDGEFHPLAVAALHQVCSPPRPRDRAGRL